MFDGERIEGPNAHVAFVPQKDLLLPWRTVIENVMLGVEIQRVPPGVFVAILMLTLVGGLAYVLVILIERRVLSYMPKNALTGF